MAYFRSDFALKFFMSNFVSYPVYCSITVCVNLHEGDSQLIIIRLRVNRKARNCAFDSFWIQYQIGDRNRHE